MQMMIPVCVTSSELGLKLVFCVHNSMEVDVEGIFETVGVLLWYNRVCYALRKFLSVFEHQLFSVGWPSPFGCVYKVVFYGVRYE